MSDETRSFKKYKIGEQDVEINPVMPVEMVQYNNKIYFVNGNYPIIRNNGNENSVIGVISGRNVEAITDKNTDGTANLDKKRLQGVKYVCIHNERIFVAQRSGRAKRKHGGADRRANKELDYEGDTERGRASKQGVRKAGYV